METAIDQQQAIQVHEQILIGTGTISRVMANGSAEVFRQVNMLQFLTARTISKTIIGGLGNTIKS